MIERVGPGNTFKTNDVTFWVARKKFRSTGFSGVKVLMAKDTIIRHDTSGTEHKVIGKPLVKIWPPPSAD